MTARAGTETAAANGALGHIGEPAIADIAADNAPARNCRLFFGTERDALLAEYEWNFATTWCVPAMDPDAALGPLTKRYPLPADCITVRFVDGLEEDAWAVEAATVDSAGAAVDAKVLVSNAEAPNVCYTRRIDTVALWDPLFLKTFECRLAIRVAPTIGRDASLAQSKLKECEDQLDKAKKADSREKAPKTVSTATSWLSARRGGFRR